ncbi:MAG: hypothetical protein CMP59_11200 [Flavobacteriales bacterium]|nr:hypothetical protein [Flavobacteriales bacterium]|tara:strand:+ start:528 stop:1022 length:495 start_codon:yes stop_codon:yes gene_type:complete
MKTIKLLPRPFRIVGLILVSFCIFQFVRDPEVVFGETSILGSKIESNWKAKVPSLFVEEKGEFFFIKMIENDISNEILLTLMLLGTYFIAFAKIKEEDEFSYQLRMEAMSQAHLWNGILLLLANWLFYDGIFLYAMIWGLFSFLLIFSFVFALKLSNQRNLAES